MKIIEREYFGGELEDMPPFECYKNTKISDKVKSVLKEKFHCLCNEIEHITVYGKGLGIDKIFCSSMIKCNKCMYYIHIEYDRKNDL